MKSAHKGTVAERMADLARKAGVRPEELFTMTVVEFMRRLEDMRTVVVEVQQ